MTARTALAVALMAPALAAIPATGNEFMPMLEALTAGEIATIISDPDLIAAVQAQNGRTAGLGADEIEGLDRQWRGEIGGAETPLIDAVVANELAERLRVAQLRSGGLFTEIFVMDAMGLNVAASGITSDYWQGDEAKWQRTFGAGVGAVHIGEVEFDESTQTYQSQISVAIADPDSARPIGAATFGVNVEMLN